MGRVFFFFSFSPEKLWNQPKWNSRISCFKKKKEKKKHLILYDILTQILKYANIRDLHICGQYIYNNNKPL